uniref:Uncharacterized protein n=1 Tax=Anguilla anguilla TaxID=7936 RepID=A0A0E9WDG8_ANGAN
MLDRWSPLVGPIFKMATGILLSLAARRNLYPEYTCIEEPATNTPSDSSSFFSTKFTVSLFTVSPKNVTSGFSMPPQLSQDGTRKCWTFSSERKTSPSGATPLDFATHPGLRAVKRSCSVSRAQRDPHPRHTTL